MISAYKSKALILSAAFSFLTSCGAKKVSDRTPTARGLVTFPTGTQVATTASRGGVKATLDPNSTSAQLITLDSGALSGVSVAFPPGSLSIPMTVTVAPGANISGATLLNDLGVTGNSVTTSGTPIEITASVAKDLRSPMVLAIPVPTGTGLVGTTVDRANMAVFYRVKVSEGDSTGSYTGIVPANTLGYQNGKVLFETKFFGWYSVVILANPAPAAIEVKARYADQIAAMRFATTADLPACTNADVDRIAYVSSAATNKHWVYCNGSAWTAVTDNPVAYEIPTPEEVTPPIRLLKADGTEIGRVVSAASPWKVLVTGSAGNDYLIYLDLDNADPSVGILSTNLSYSSLPPFFSGTFTGSSVYFESSDCTGNGYVSTYASVKWAKAPMYINTSGGSMDGWYYYSSSTSTSITYNSYLTSSTYGAPMTCSTSTYTNNMYPIQKISETLPILFSGTWSVE